MKINEVLYYHLLIIFGRNFIENSTVKLKQYLKSGDLQKMSEEMRDCDNITRGNKKIKVRGLTKRRAAEIELFRS